MKKTFAVFLMLISFGLSGCSFFTKQPTGTSSSPSSSIAESSTIQKETTTQESSTASQESSVVSSESQPPAALQTVVTLYFPNQKYIEFGQEADNYYLTEERTVPAEETNLAQFVVMELLKGPLNTPNASSGIPTSVQLNRVKEIDRTAYVDLKQEGLNGGSLQEYFLINQVVKSLLALDNVEAVQFLVDGKVVETLMGHYEVSQAFTSEID